MTKDKTHPETIYVGYYFAQGDGIVHSLVPPDHERAVEYIRADLCPKPEKIDGLKKALKDPLTYSAKADCLKIREEVIKAAQAYLKLTEGK